MSSSKTGIQRVELMGQEVPHCPFCGQQPITGVGADIHQLKPCCHTLFVATDEGFEYRSYAFDAAMGIIGVDAGDIVLGDDGYDAFTDAIQLDNTVKFAIYAPAPSFFGAYFGFAESL